MTAKLYALEAQMAEMHESAHVWTAEIAALDRTVALLHPSADSAAAGSVNASAGRYGTRGGLTTFVMDHLKSISPQSMTGPEVAALVTKRFKRVLLTKMERRIHRNSVIGTLRRLRDRYGVIEKVLVQDGLPRWRWKQSKKTTRMTALPVGFCVE